MSEQIADEQDTPKPDADKLTAMARLKLRYIEDNRKLEAATLERDSAYQDARKRYQDAAARVSQLRDDQMLATAEDPTLVSLRQRLADARIEKTAAHVYYREAIDARGFAVDYAYFYRDTDRRNPYSAYGLYGGSGGYGYEYGAYGFRY